MCTKLKSDILAVLFDPYIITWLVPHETAAILVHSVYTIVWYNHVTSFHAKPHMYCKVHVYSCTPSPFLFSIFT